MVPEEIRQRYAAGERVIDVSPETFEAYRSGLTVLTRVTPHESREPAEKWLAYKAARVTMK